MCIEPKHIRYNSWLLQGAVTLLEIMLVTSILCRSYQAKDMESSTSWRNYMACGWMQTCLEVMIEHLEC